MSLLANILKNGFATSLQKGLRVLEQLVLVPFFIKYWGAEYYGEWLTLSIIPSVIALSDLGFGTAAGNTFVLRYLNGDKRRAADMAISGFWTISFIFIFGILITISFILFINYFNFFNDSIIPKNEIIVAISLLMGTRMLVFFRQLFESFFRASQNASFGIQMGNIYMVFNILASFIVLFLGGKIISFSLVSIVIGLIFTPIIGLISVNMLKYNDWKNAKVNFSDIKDALKTGFGFMLNPLWQSIYFQGSTFVVRLVLGPSSVAVFNTVRTLSRSVNQVFTIVNSSVFPELQILIGKNDWSKVRQLFRISIITTFVFATFGMLFLFFFGLWFYEIWTNNELNPPILMWNIFVIGIGLNSLWWISGIVFRAINQPFKFAFSGLIASIISVISIYFFTKLWGLEGAALGAMLLDLLLVIYLVPLTFKTIGQPLSSFFKDCLDYDIPKLVSKR